MLEPTGTDWLHQPGGVRTLVSQPRGRFGKSGGDHDRVERRLLEDPARSVADDKLDATRSQRSRAAAMCSRTQVGASPRSLA